MTPDKPPVLRATKWRNNGAMIADVRRLGYITDVDFVLDPTFGRGTWWKTWQPPHFIGHDLATDGVDFRDMHHLDAAFSVVAYDPPYKLNGTPTPLVDSRFGVHVPSTWQARMVLCKEGATECARVLAPGGILLWKCQDQVCSGAVRWQTDDFTRHAESLDLVKVDRFDYLGGRAQPKRKRKDGKPSVQQHARSNYSTLLVFRKRAS